MNIFNKSNEINIPKLNLFLILILSLLFLFSTATIIKAETSNFILSGGPNPTNNFCVDDDIYVYLNGSLIYSDIDPRRASCNNLPVHFEANFGDELRVIAIDSMGICRSISPLYLHYENQSVKLDSGRNDGCKGWPAGVKFYDKTFTIPELVKNVPLYTQVESNYPPRLPEDEWANLDYAKGGIGVYSCAKNTNATIARCGCAITSIVMIARYYDITEAQGQDVNPGEINEWLRDNNGYQNGNVNWIAGARYTDWRITYAKTDKSIDNYALLDQYLNQDNPVIAKANVGRGGINRQHFFVIDNILASTYGVKDPAWYNTKTLNETTDTSNHIRGYENGFDGLRIYKKGNGIAQSAIIIVLGSPAELLITDFLGRKLGKDANGVEYDEIPNAWYFEDGIDDPTEENPPVDENNKIIQILEPMDGEYKLEVIGTGQGDYSLDTNFYDTQSNANNQSFQSETALGYTAQYNISFNSSDSSNNIIESTDEIPPEAEIYFNTSTQELIVKGVDNATVNPIVSVVENTDEQTIYQIQDEAGNATKLLFEKIKQHGKQIKAELKSFQYNDSGIISLPKTDLKYECSLNKDQTIKELNQRIKAEDNFEIQAKYNHQKNETEIKIKLQNQEEQRQIFPGIKIIKLIMESGILEFKY